MKPELITIAIVVLIFACMLLIGCTAHFKASELEFDYEHSRTYELQGLDLFGIPILSCGPDPPLQFDSGLRSYYASP